MMSYSEYKNAPWYKVAWRKFRKWEPMYWLRTHTIHRYHIIDISNSSGYRWGWVDRDHAMFLACFKILDDFMTKEYPGFVDWRHDDETKRVSTEFHLLHFWWKHQREREIEEVANIHSAMWSRAKKKKSLSEDDVWLSSKNVSDMFSETSLDLDYQEWQNAENWLAQRDQEMLKRLIEIREWMWT